MAKKSYLIYVNPQETDEPNKEQSYYQWEVTPDNIVAFQNNVKSGLNPNLLPLHYVQSPEDVLNNRIRMTMYPNERDAEFVLPTTPKKPAGFIDKALLYINDEVLLNKDNVRARNYSKAMDRNPAFSYQWDGANNIYEFVNHATAGILNRLSPTQNIGLAIDAVQGDNVWDSWMGNSGIVSDNFARNHPWIAMAANMAGDVGVAKGFKPTQEWLTTPLFVGEGASKKVFFKRYKPWEVISVGGDPEYTKLQNSMPRSLKLKFLGYNEFGKPLHSQLRVWPIKKPSKGYIKDLVKNNFFPTRVEGDPEMVYINPATKQVLLDNELGRTWWGKIYNFDPEILSTDEYFSILKNGGLLLKHQLKGK